jgi:thioredoxin reductase (NADPH)
MSELTGTRQDAAATASPGGSQAGPAEETPDIYGCYPRLSEAQMTALASLGSRRPTAPGEILFREGDQSCNFFVVRAGKAAVVEGHGTPEEQVIGVHGPGRFLGELSLLTGGTVPITAVTVEPGEVLEIPIAGLRDVVAQDPVVGDLILRAYLARRSMLIGLGAGLRIVGSRYSADARRLRDFASRNRLPHRWIDLETDEWAEALLRQLGVSAGELPIVILYGRNILRNPSNAELAAALGLSVPAAQEEVCDLLVVGAGPAGLAAAVSAASEGLSTVAVDGLATGGQAGTSSRIENYLGFPSGISGAELAERAALQAMKFGARITVPVEATAITERNGYYEIATGTDTALCGRMIILASGVRYRRLNVPGMDTFEEASVYYAASQTEAQVCLGDPVAVAGGGNSAGQASLFLARHADMVRLLVREDDLAENMSRYLADRVERCDRIKVNLHCDVSALLGRDGLELVEVTDNRSGERRTLPARALFVFIGAAPHTSWLGSQLALDDHGYVLTGDDAARSQDEAARAASGQPLPLETTWPGVFAAGDVRSGSIKRVASAVGEGAMAVRMAHERRAR